MFERANVATDHQQLLMVTLKKVAQKHGMECLFHEKPFAGINGSGKHVNFSLGNATEGNLLAPRRHPARQRPVPRVLRRRDPRRAQVRRPAAGVGGLGQQRPPPRRQRGAAGDHLDLPRRPAHRRVRPDRQGRRDQLEGEGHAHHRCRHAARRCPPTRATATAPARSPSPATASSSGRRARCSRSPARWSRSTRSWPSRSTTSPPSSRRRIADGAEFNVAVQKVLEEIITEHGAVVFNGDGYSDDWQVEAEARGLLEPAHHGRRAPAARSPPRRMELFETLRRVQRPGDAQPLRDRPRAVRAERRRGGPARPSRWPPPRCCRPRCATRPSWRRTSPA